MGGAVEKWSEELELFSFGDVVRGIVPAAVQKLMEAVGVERKVARAKVLEIWNWAVKEAKEKIWKPRCEMTVEWEMENGITEVMKRKQQKGDSGGDQPAQPTKKPHPRKSTKSNKPEPHNTCPTCFSKL
ncbi:hypothetical protein HDU98_002161 [Podochytrium sp. JEL0797]|nr:hypothetical protein HDU98_002161 [Podochytrium sp. JEL0797]